LVPLGGTRNCFSAIQHVPDDRQRHHKQYAKDGAAADAVH
jgi:hypothetical protein